MEQDEQLRAIIQRMVERGDDKATMAEVIRNYDARKAADARPSGGASGSWDAPDPHAKYGPMQQLLREQANPEQTRAESLANAPAIGATVAGLATGGLGLIPSAIASGLGAYGGARLRGDSNTDAVGTGLLNAAIPVTTGPVIRGLATAGPKVVNLGRSVARSTLKPTLDAGRKEAARLFGRPAMASQANDAVVERALQRGIMGADNPEMAVSQALDTVEGQLKKVVGDQPTKAANLLRAVFQRGRHAATGAPKDVPGAKQAIENQIEAVRTGSLGGKLNEGYAPVTAREALGWSRRMSKDNAWDKPASNLEGWFGKSLESAGRTAVKRAVPEARPMLKEMGDLLSLQRVIPQAMNREANRNTVTRLPGMLAAVMTGHPIKGAASLLGMNLAEANSGKVAQTLYNAGQKIPGMSDAMARRMEMAIRAALISQLNGEPPEP